MPWFGNQRSIGPWKSFFKEIALKPFDVIWSYRSRQTNQNTASMKTMVGGRRTNWACAVSMSHVFTCPVWSTTGYTGSCWKTTGQSWMFYCSVLLQLPVNSQTVITSSFCINSKSSFIMEEHVNLCMTSELSKSHPAELINDGWGTEVPAGNFMETGAIGVGAEYGWVV